ncbi:MAG: hypothetical protein M3Y32_13430 [Pseudomonadota bacterium]|nr:hypothetical protein [Pseudomonadota bacterium]
MSTFEPRTPFNIEAAVDANYSIAIEAAPGDRHASLREIGSRAHQLRASARAADHFNARDTSEDHSTGSWLISGALGLARELAEDLDVMARALRDEGTDSVLSSKVAALRTRAYQVHAAARAADHFLDQDAPDDRETGSWLIATAHGLARKLAAEIDDSVMPLRRPAFDKVQLEPHDPDFMRRMAAATVPMR